MRCRWVFALVFLLLGCQTPKVGPSVSASPLAAEGPTTLANLRFRGQVTNMVIEGDTIKSIGESSEGTIIDCSELSVVPGFVDTHVHLGFYQPEQLLKGGLTAVRDLGWTPEVSYEWTKQSRESVKWGPLVVAVGPMLTVPDGYPFRAGWAPKGTGLVYGHGAIERLAKKGVCAIKVTLEPRVGPTISGPALVKLVESAHDQELKVTAHVSTVAELEKALEAGVDELSHFLFDDSEVPQELIEQMVAQKVVVVPTLRVNPSPKRLDNLRRFHTAGGQIVFGTDLGNGGPPGIDTEELTLMSKAGLPPETILYSATEGAAKHLGLKNRGMLEVGAYADLLLVKGDPLKDWQVLKRPLLVMREGTVVLNKL